MSGTEYSDFMASF